YSIYIHCYDLYCIIPLALSSLFFFFTHPPTTDIYTLSLHDALPICFRRAGFSPALTLLMSAFALLIPPACLAAHLRRLRERSPTACRSEDLHTHSFGARLSPVNLPREPTRPVSYYAFFKRLLLLSQPPCCLCLLT